MPEFLIKERFKNTFLMDQFVVNENTAFALNYKNITELLKKAKNRDGLAQILASTELYNGNQIISMAKQFGVSVGAMAIRLDELDLLTWK